MIKDLLEQPIGKEVGGFPLLIKVARRPFEGDVRVWQEVVFMDASGEMLGHILLAENSQIGQHKDKASYHQYESKTNLCILKGMIQAADDKNKTVKKLVVTEHFNTATPLTWDQQQELTEDEWRQLRQNEISGKIRHGITLVWIPVVKRLTIPEGEKKLINQLVEFVKNG